MDENRAEMIQDFEKIGQDYGKDIYPGLDNSEKAVIAFGMFPLKIMERSDAHIRSMLTNAVQKKFGNIFDSECLEKIISLDVILAFQNGVVLGILFAAKEAGNLVA